MKDSKYYKRIKKRDNNYNSGWLNKLLISIIIVLVCLILCNFSTSFRENFEYRVLEENMKFNDFNKIYNIPIGRYEVTGYIGKLGGTFNDNPIINFNETIDITFSGNIELHGKCNDILIISDNEFSIEISGLGKSDSHKYGEYYYYFENRVPGCNYIVTTKQQRISFSIDHYDKIQYYYIKE
jgi:hypothetical protein